MLILALETSDLAGSVALLRDTALVAERPLGHAKRSAQSLAPAIDQLLRDHGIAPGNLNLIAVTAGPGSFTSLRVGVTTAKTLAYAVGCQVVGVNTLEAIAVRALPAAGPVWAVIDAQRQQLFVSKFEAKSDGTLQVLVPTQILSAGDWIAQLAPGDTITGPGLAKVAQDLPATIKSIDPDRWPARAAEIGILGFAAYRAGRADVAFKLLPNYYRRTAAEEQWARKNARPIA